MSKCKNCHQADCPTLRSHGHRQMDADLYAKAETDCLEATARRADIARAEWLYVTGRDDKAIGPYIPEGWVLHDGYHAYQDLWVLALDAEDGAEELRVFASGQWDWPGRVELTKADGIVAAFADALAYWRAAR